MKNILNQGASLLFFLILIGSWIPLSGQDNDSTEKKRDHFYKNSLALEVYGHSQLYSVGYERLIKEGDAFTGTLRMGITVLPIRTAIPISFQLYNSPGDHHIFVSLGVNFLQDRKKPHNFDYLVYPGIGIGYRYQQRNSRWWCQLGYVQQLIMDPEPGQIIDPEREWNGAIKMIIGYNIFNE